MIDISVYKEAAYVGATIALDNELHMPSHMNWELRHRLITVRDRQAKATIAIARNGLMPVAVVLVRMTRDGKSPFDVAAYCKDAFRRKGITTQLIAAMKKEQVEFPEARTGIVGSADFWNKNGIPCPNIYF
jgi:hypothetical protein